MGTFSFRSLEEISWIFGLWVYLQGNGGRCPDQCGCSRCYLRNQISRWTDLIKVLAESSSLSGFEMACLKRLVIEKSFGRIFLSYWNAVPVNSSSSSLHCNRDHSWYCVTINGWHHWCSIIVYISWYPETWVQVTFKSMKLLSS